jgi:hypothetical protein
MNKELILEALKVLKIRVEESMDASDAHYSIYFREKINKINQEIIIFTN